MVTASATALHRSSFSSSVRVEPSPVVPATTRPSLPWSASQRASWAATSRSSAPSPSNGVTIAVMTAPNLAMAPSVPASAHGPDLATDAWAGVRLVVPRLGQHRAQLAAGQGVGRGRPVGGHGEGHADDVSPRVDQRPTGVARRQRSGQDEDLAADGGPAV